MFNKDFFPTPRSLINKMLSKLDFKTISSVLEPSGGKGDIIDAVVDKFRYSRSSYNKEIKYDIDTIEIDENLQHILRGKGYRVIHNDFLTFNSYKSYSVIVANFPFSDGEKHLLKALEIQQNGGSVVCLLNAETLRNPYSNTRKDLLRKLEDYHADIEYIQNAFIDAERPTGVEIALISITIPKPDNDSIILDDLKRQEQFRAKPEQNNTNQLINADYIKGIVEQYNFEVKTGLKLIAEYEALKPLMLNSFDKDAYSKHCILKLTLDDHNYEKYPSENLPNAYIKKVRIKYWKALFTNEQFIGLFTSNLRQKYMDKINELEDYDFSIFNIYTIRIQLSSEMLKGVEDTIIKLFDEFSYQSSWDNEFSKNIHYYSGWSTNKCWKINDKKVIIRLNGFNEWSSNKFKPTDYNVVNKLTDIEKVFNYLSTGTNIEINEIDIKTALNFAEQYGDSKKIELTYFYVTFYKKGTCHLEWKDQDLIHRFNIYAGQNKNNLPPSYGKKTYTEMSEEEQQVINEFEGELSYRKVMSNKNDYILDNNKLLMLA